MEATKCWAPDCTQPAEMCRDDDDFAGLCAAHARAAIQGRRIGQIEREDAIPALEALCKLTGWGSDGETAFAATFVRQHRTHQQSIIRMIMNLLIEMDLMIQRDGWATWTDGRNHASYDLAQLIVKEYGDKMRLLPRI